MPRALGGRAAVPAERVRGQPSLVLLGLSPVADLGGGDGDGLGLLGDLDAGRQPGQRGDQRRALEPKLPMAVGPVFPQPGHGGLPQEVPQVRRAHLVQGQAEALV
eukprot:7444523-Lingulodinium_polyedra.AAC.1